MKERVAELSSEVSALRRHNSSIEEEKRRMEEQLVRHKNATLESQDKHTQALQVIYLFTFCFELFTCLFVNNRPYSIPGERHRIVLNS